MRRALLSLVVAFLCLSTTGWGASAAAIKEPGALTVLSLNLAMREDVDQIAAELTRLGVGQTDLLLLQEVVRRGDGPDVAAATRRAARSRVLVLHRVHVE